MRRPILYHAFSKAFTIEDLYDNKIFIIDELIIKNDLTILPYDLGKPLILSHVILKNSATAPHNPSRKLVYFETPDGKEWGAANISMSNPVGFAIKLEKKKGRINAMLTTLLDKQHNKREGGM